MQLLFAAVKYTPAGRPGPGRHGDRVRARRCGWTTWTCPAGCGPDLFPHLYYGAIANPADVPGPDQGLAVAKRMLDAHHATVALSDRPGDGTSCTSCSRSPNMV